MTADKSSIHRFRLDRDIPFWRDERVLRAVAQIVSAILVFGFLYLAITNVLQAAEQRGLSLGFRFMAESAGFPIGESDLPYDPSRSFAYAFWVGVVNTLKVSLIGIVLATMLGTLVGVARLSTNWLVSQISFAFIEFHRNIPLLVLLLLWYRGVFTKLPRVQESITFPGPIYVNQRGFFLTWPRVTETGQIFVWLSTAGLILAVIAFAWLRQVRATSGRTTYFVPVSLGILLVFPILGWIVSGGQPLEPDIPVLNGFNFSGGWHATPEFSALLIGLVTYTAAFIAEVVRAGIQAVNRGQLEAASALGLGSMQVLGLVIMPQALRVIIPPLISQYLSLVKNSSLAVFIGYPELFFIGKTTINQAGRAVQVFVLIMAVYLVISLVTSGLLNIYNRRIQLVER